MHRITVVLFGAVLIATACNPVRSGPEETPQPERSVRMVNGAIVLSGRALEDGSGTVLAAMAHKVPSFRIQRHAEMCPEIVLRSHVSFSGQVNPHVYVDGTRATDTCILEALRTDDVERVEVYPLGFTTRPGYGRHAQGLILVFLRSAG
ncbi:MAG: hypothetical protein ACREL7_12865 [Longimicrobiales bacterium]